MSEPDLSDPNLPRLIWRLGLPAMAGLSLNALHQTVDAIFVGYLGTDALAALILLAPMAGLVAAAGIGLGVGTASSIAHALGRGDINEARQISGLSFCAAGLLSLVMVGALIMLREPLITLLDAPESLRHFAIPYLFPLALTIGLSIIQILCDFTAIGRGNVQFSLRTLALCFGLNIVLDPLFIFGFDLGLPGAAWATLTAQTVTLTVWAWHFWDRQRRPKSGPITLLFRVIGIALPEAGSVAMTTLGLLIVLSMAGSLGGPDALAATGIAIRLVFFVILPLEGFAIGVQPILAHAFGANQHERIRQTLIQFLKLALFVTGSLMLVFLLCSVPLARIFTGEADIAKQAGENLQWLAFALPAIAIRLGAQILLQAAFRPRSAAILGLAPMGWMLFPLLAVLSPYVGVGGLAISITLAAGLSALLAMALIRHTLTQTYFIGAMHDAHT